MEHTKPHFWNDKYLAGTPGWDRGGSSPALHHWLEEGTLLPGRVLIPGCGRGHEALELARRGFRVTALDIAPAALEHLQAELDRAGLQADLVLADALAWHPDAPFDAIYEQTCLCALDPSLWSRYDGQLHAWLRPGGQLLAVFMQTGRAGVPPFHCALPDMRALLPDSRWHWEGTPHREVPHPNGHFEYTAVLTRL
jgi:methyl halide transferase